MGNLTVTLKNDPSDPERLIDLAKGYKGKFIRKDFQGGDTTLEFSFPTTEQEEAFKTEAKRIIPRELVFGGSYSI